MRAGWLRTAGLLMGWQVVLGALAYFVYGSPWLARGVGALLLILFWMVTAQRLVGRPRREVWAAAVLSQLPGWVGSVSVLLEQLGVYSHNSVLDIVDFVMETWHTALLPWATLLPGQKVLTFSGERLAWFFIALPLLSPLLTGFVAAAAWWGAARQASAAKRQDAA